MQLVNRLAGGLYGERQHVFLIPHSIDAEYVA